MDGGKNHLSGVDCIHSSTPVVGWTKMMNMIVNVNTHGRLINIVLKSCINDVINTRRSVLCHLYVDGFRVLLLKVG